MMVQWSVNVSPETDQRLQSLLKQKGQQKDLLSQYVEEAVKEALPNLSCQINKQNAKLKNI
jgi:predicted DNA-binding protein